LFKFIPTLFPQPKFSIKLHHSHVGYVVIVNSRQTIIISSSVVLVAKPAAMHHHSGDSKFLVLWRAPLQALFYKYRHE